MTENQRESFRIGPDANLEAELFHEGLSKPCTLVNLSAGGAKVTSRLQLEPGTTCTLGLRLGAGLRPAASTAFVQLPMTVLDHEPRDGSGATTYRLRSTSPPGSSEYEAATKLVLQAQRLQRSHATGADESSPMVSDEQRRAKLRIPRAPRFSKGSLRPGSGSE